ncbi:DgyrCDS8503 [Dimorphilus gyrociliatus]|uniref:UDP-N-acetylglucosamine diphosphorylase n=1 Tax=Dimorphilus gyrociliatus TaxID=2664684 RepID=A0A7I8VZH6_9ANNE|nr:DgyrCDS8503 [Dimorphilus gyrociliatus]
MEKIKQVVHCTDQSHLIEKLDELNEEEQALLFKDLSLFDFFEVNSIFKKCIEGMKNTTKLDKIIEPLPKEIIGSSIKSSPDELSNFTLKGYEEISKNKVALILLAGGQGTRLGVPYPKGMYDVGLPSHKTLYQLQAEKILKVQENAKQHTNSPSATVTWYIMTSEHTKESTEEFLKMNNYFGLKSENVIIFEQHMLPCFSFEGKIILESPFKISKAPDGNGGLYKALKTNYILEDMKTRGIQHVHVYGVDNILVKLADPAFIGFCLSQSACCGAKFVEKTDPAEAVGVICKVKDHFEVVEYTEITSETAEKRCCDGSLLYSVGNITNHYFHFDFLMKVCSGNQELLHHVAKKKIPFLNKKGETEKPTMPNGIKMEKYVFDVFQFAKRFVVWEVSRDDEFSPLKNADGAKDSTPTTCKNMFLDLCRRYVVKAGGSFSNTEKEEDFVCEISPLRSYSGEDLKESIEGKTFKSPLLLYGITERQRDVMNKV